VITKPDRVDKGAERIVVDLLEGRKTDNFVRGFHMVKCRGQSELDEGIDISEGIAREETYFNTHLVWKTIGNRSLLGVNKLRNKLADIQADMFRNDIPKIIEEIKHLKELNAKKLISYGLNPNINNNRRIMYNEYLNTVLKRLECDIMGYFGKQWRHPDTKYFLRAQIEHYYCEFGEALRQTTLGSLLTLKVGNAVLVTHSDGQQYPGKIVKVFSETNKVLIEPLPQKDFETSKWIFYDQNAHGYSASTNCCVVTKEEKPERQQQQQEDSEEMCWYEPNKTYQYIKFNRDDINIQNDHSQWLQKLINAHRTHCLTVFLSAEVFHSIIAELVTDEWHDCCETLLHKLHTLFIDCITQIINTTISHTSHEYCRKWMLEHILTMLKSKFDAMKQSLDEMIVSEYIPYANDDELFEEVTKRKHIRLMKLLKAQGKGFYQQYNNVNSQQTAVPLPMIDTVFRDFESSPYNKPVYYMQDILAMYGDLIVKATRDAVPKQIEAHLLRTLQSTVCKELQNVEEMRLEKEVFVEPSVVVSGRKKCQETMIKMERALNALNTEFRQ